MRRSFAPEIIDRPGLPEDVLERAHRDITRINRFLGNTAAILGALARDPLPVRRVLDIGCGRGALLVAIRHRLGVEVVGVEREPQSRAPVPIVVADAVRDPLPEADVAVCSLLAHHLRDEELIALIRNAGRACRRLILLDLVRHRLPLALFRIFVAPWVSPVVAADGAQSVRRAFTPAEFAALVRAALAPDAGAFRHSVAPGYIRQVVDISYRR
jgi:SAM-dependent methyltransferase